MTEPMPESLNKKGYYWFLRHVHNNAMRKNKHFALLMCGESGSGKSWDSLAVAQALYPKMIVKDSVAFSPTQFLDMTEIHHPKLFPYIIDDAGLSAFSGDALTSQVKNLSKVAQSIRHTNCQIIFNLPNIDMLAKSVRLTNHYYAEPLWIDYTNKLSYMKFQRLRTFSDKLMYRNIKTNDRYLNEVTGYYHCEPSKHLNFPIPAPSEAIIRDYENLKTIFMTSYRSETAESMRQAKAKELGVDVNKVKLASDTMRDSIHEFTTMRGAADMGKIMAEFGLGQNAARISYRMAMLPKNKEAVIEGQDRMKEAAKKHVPWSELERQ